MSVNVRTYGKLSISLGIFLAFIASGALGNEYGVYISVTKNYDKNVRPVKNISTTTVVSGELTYFVLLSMDQIQETVTFMTEIELIWNDEIARWNTSLHGGTTSALIPASLLWKPDIIVTTGLNVDYMMPEDLRYVNVLSDGTVRSSSPCVITNQCLLSVQEFPYDVQTCHVTLGSWMYASSQIDMAIGHKLRDPNTTNLADLFKGNGEWTLISMEPSINYTEENDQKFAVLRYTIKLKRQPIYYTCVLLVPTFMTATICLLGLFVPAMNTGERIEKVNMGLATLLSMAVILGIVSGEMPKSTTLPLLGFYVLAELILCTLGVGLSMIIMVAHQRATTRVLVPPRWINIIVLFKFHEHKKPEKTDVSPVYTEKIIMNKTEDKTSDQIENIKNALNTKRLNEVLDKVQEYIDDKTFEEYLLLQWVIIFDRIDTFFLVLFNFVNIIMSGILLLS